MCIKIDNNLIAWLKSKANKGRYINNLIKKDMRDSWTGKNWEEVTPYVYDDDQPLDERGDYEDVGEFRKY